MDDVAFWGGVILISGFNVVFYFRMGGMKSDIRGIITRLVRIENAFQLKLKRESE